MLSGKKTYIVGGLWLIATGLHIFGVIDQSLLTTVEAILGPLGLAALRAGVSRA